MSAIFGDDVVDMHGHIEHGQDFLKEPHNIERFEHQNSSEAKVEEQAVQTEEE